MSEVLEAEPQVDQEYFEPPMPDWFPQLADGELICFRRDCRPNSNERWTDAHVKSVHASSTTPNIDVRRHGREEFINVLHIDDPRLTDPDYLALFKNAEAPPADGVFKINAVRERDEAERKAIWRAIEELRGEIRRRGKRDSSEA